MISRPFEPQVIALGTCEWLWNSDASNPWLRTVDLWPEGIRQRTATGEWEAECGVGLGGWAELDRESIL